MGYVVKRMIRVIFYCFLIPLTAVLVFFVLCTTRPRFSENKFFSRDPVPAIRDDRNTFSGHQKRLDNTIPGHPQFRYNENRTEGTYPWKDDPECSRFGIHFGHGLPRIYLISYPRSGNSWIRHLLHGATGFWTGSVYYSKKLHVLGYLGELENAYKGTTLFIKQHLFSHKVTNGTKANTYQSNAEKYPSVLLIRNPKNSIESLMSYITSGGNLHSNGSRRDFRKLDKKFNQLLTNWEWVATLLLKSSHYLHVVVYENLKADPMTEIRKIMHFIQMPVDPERLACVEKYKEGSVNRGQPEFEPFDAQQIAAMAAAVERVNALVVERGYPPLPFAA